MIPSDPIVRAYGECALWVGLDWDDDNPTPLDRTYNLEDITAEAWEAMAEDVNAFVESESADLDGMEPEQIGYDFFLTRNHHGVGFWDHGLGARGDRLTKAAHVYGESDLYVGDDGKLHIS